MNYMAPFGLEIDFPTGIINPTAKLSQRRLSDMRNMYSDTTAVERIVQQEGDRLIYEVYAAELPEEEGQVLYCTTIIHPGQIGSEYHMTKGHYHTKRDRAEVYLGLAGEGYLLLQVEDGTVRSVPMQAGTLRLSFSPHGPAMLVTTTGRLKRSGLASYLSIRVVSQRSLIIRNS